MIDSIKLYVIIDAVQGRTDIVHPAVKNIFGDAHVHLSEPSIYRDSASVTLFLSWPSNLKIRYKWFRRVVDLLNKEAAGSGLVFVPNVESFECEFTDHYKTGVQGLLSIDVLESNAPASDCTEDDGHGATNTG